MSDFNTHTPGKKDIDKIAVIGSNMGWVKPWAGTGLGAPESIVTAINCWAEVSSVWDEAAADIAAIDANEFNNDKGRTRDMNLAYAKAAKRYSEIDRRIDTTKGNMHTLAIHLERDGKVTPDAADQRQVAFWQHHQSTHQLELETLYRDLVEQEGPENPNHQWMAVAIEEMVDFNTGRRRLPDDVVADGRRIRGARKDPARARELAGLRGAISHLQQARQSLDSHLRDVFGQPKRDAIADAARGFNGQ